MTERELLVRLALTEGVGPRTIRTMMERWDKLPLLYAMTARDIMALGMRPEIAERIVVSCVDGALYEKTLESAYKGDARLVVLGDAEYPSLLAAVDDAPIVLWVKGSQLNFSSAIAVVGSRAADSYGLRMVDVIVEDLVTAGAAVVSGGARGIDAAAHRAAIVRGGVTVAVWGSGLNRPYPSEHRKLFEDIVASGGALVSPFNMNVSPVAGNFPARNRVISGLSNGTIVVQAAAKSGALGTARGALEQGRDVGAVPGQADSLLHAGCHELIRDGALLVTRGSDILRSLGIAAQLRAIPADRTETMITSVALQGAHEVQPVAFQGATLASAREFTGVEGCVVKLCKKPQSFDALVEATGCDEATMHTALFELMVAGAVEQNSGGFWVLSV